MGLFRTYLFADYSGAGEDHRSNRSIRLWTCSRTGAAVPVPGPFSRNSLRQAVESILAQADPGSQRIVFGFDHQYAWPPLLRRSAKLGAGPWRQAILSLAWGEGGRPGLDIPGRFCKAFNRWAGAEVFWSPLKGRAAAYGIGNRPPAAADAERFRLSELARPLKPCPKPKPADCVGGMGEGLVGGQTICGLRQLATLLLRPDVAWWPFDGLDIRGPSYEGKHVGVEIYPSALRPAHVPRSDDNDARESCLYMRRADADGSLPALTDLGRLASGEAACVLSEGWIIGIDPAATRRSWPHAGAGEYRSGGNCGCKDD